MKFAIFSAIVTFAVLANCAVYPPQPDVTTQEINKVMSDLLKYKIDQIQAKQPIPIKLGTVSIKNENIDVQVEFKDIKQTIGRLGSQSQSSSLTESDVSAGFHLIFEGLVNDGSAHIIGTINKKPVDLLGKFTVLSPDLPLSFEIKAKHDPKSVTVVDLDYPVFTNLNLTVTLSDFQVEEVKMLEKAIEDGLKNQIEEAQKAAEKGKSQVISEINTEWKGQNLRVVIDLISWGIPKFKTLFGF